MRETASSSRRSSTQLRVPSRLDIDDQFGWWFTGLFDGEGTLRASAHKGSVDLAAILGLRNDDAEVIALIQRTLGGRIHSKQVINGRYQVVWHIKRIQDLAEIILPLFDRYPLHTKKAREYAIWRTLVLHKYFRPRFYAYGLAGSKTEFYRRHVERIRDIRHMRVQNGNLELSVA